MPVVKMEGIGETTCPEGKRLVLAIEDSGVDILHRCGGNARCTTCRVEVVGGDAGPMTEPEQTRLARLQDWPEDLRLSCQIQVRDDLTVRVLRRLRDNPDMSDSGPRPIDWPADHPLPPE
ncbi:MAG TPA: 2Fe-2S iron-sulfur cluster-binding protein [Thermomicrobiales bacterium]|nr:2Fe-2S iron-sulfur cluster-binding protein [Thermomicrobiales bacterium]